MAFRTDDGKPSRLLHSFAQLDVRSPPCHVCSDRDRSRPPGFRYDLSEIMSRCFDPEYDKSTEPLTDDFAPVDDLKATARHNTRGDL